MMDPYAVPPSGTALSSRTPPVVTWTARTASAGLDQRRGHQMAAMKPRTGDGPLEVTKEGRGIVMRVPLEGGGRLVVELNATEARELGEALTSVVS